MVNKPMRCAAKATKKAVARNRATGSGNTPSNAADASASAAASVQHVQMLFLQGNSSILVSRFVSPT